MEVFESPSKPHMLESKLFASPETNDRGFSVEWSGIASDVFWPFVDCRGGVLKYLLEYGRRELPLLKKKLKKLNRKLARHSNVEFGDRSFVCDQVDKRKLGRIQTLFTEIASHVHVATVTFTPPGLRKFFVHGIGKHVVQSRERKHSCVIEVLSTDAEATKGDEVTEPDNAEAFLDGVLDEREKYSDAGYQENPSSPARASDVFFGGWNGDLENASVGSKTPVVEVNNRGRPANRMSNALIHSANCIRIKNTEIQVYVGDLTRENADALLILNQPDLNLENGGELNRRLSQAGGAFLQMECESNMMACGSRLPGSVLVTSAGGLPCKNLIHLITASGPPQILDLQLGVKAGLQLADTLGLGSIALPAIGTGGLGLGWTTSAQTLSRGILSFLENTPQNLRQIRIVVFLESMFLTFSDEVSEEFAPIIALEEYSSLCTLCEEAERPPVLHQFIEKANAVDGRDRDARTRSKGSNAFRVRVYGKDKPSILSAVTSLQSVFAKHSSSQKVTHHIVPQLLQSSCGWTRLRDFAHQREVTLSAESNASTVTVRGNPDDVSLMVGRIWEEINTCAEEESKSEKRRLLSKYVCWYFMIIEMQIACSKKVNGILEEAHSQQYSEVSFHSNNKEYRADFTNMTISSSCGQHQSLPLLRKYLGESGNLPPSSWTPQPCYSEGHELHAHRVCLDKTSWEYQSVANMFYDTGGRGDITMIERIQNHYLYKQYSVCKEEIERTNARASMNFNELQLFHGTKGLNVRSINRQGFDRNFSGTNGAAFGNGVYFAKNASYSMSYTSNYVNGERHMYLARVMVGLYTQGSKGLRVPPSLDPLVPEVLYDSVVDNVGDPRVFVVFRDSQCYPEYLITFKR